MKEYKIIEIMGDFSTLINVEFEALSLEDAKSMVLDTIKRDIDKYMYAVVEEKD